MITVHKFSTLLCTLIFTKNNQSVVLFCLGITLTSRFHYVNFARSGPASICISMRQQPDSCLVIRIELNTCNKREVPYIVCVLKRQTGNHLARSSLLWAFWPWPPFCRTWSWRLCHSWAWRTVWGWWCVQGSPVGYTPRTGYLCIMSLAPHLKTINIHVHGLLYVWAIWPMGL